MIKAQEMIVEDDQEEIEGGGHEIDEDEQYTASEIAQMLNINRQQAGDLKNRSKRPKNAKVALQKQKPAITRKTKPAQNKQLNPVFFQLP